MIYAPDDTSGGFHPADQHENRQESHAWTVAFDLAEPAPLMYGCRACGLFGPEPVDTPCDRSEATD